MRAFIITAVTVATIIGLSACGSSNPPVLADTKSDAIISNGQNQVAVAAAPTDTVRIANDSLEYEIIIIDPGFNSWLYSRAQPRGYYGEQYLKNKNRFWVTEWNIRANNPIRYGDLYQMRIDYDPAINYGYEVNYLLYNYLVYFQNVNNQRLFGVVPTN
jgi:hypothetical protein